MKKLNQIKDWLAESGLKVTPQRIAVYKALLYIKDHPTAEMIKEYVEKDNPSISLGTVYKTLETFYEKGLIKKVKTEKDIMRYDPILKKHHHLYCIKSDTIADYYDDDLNRLLEDYFSKRNINNFKIQDIKLQIIGEFQNEE